MKRIALILLVFAMITGSVQAACYSCFIFRDSEGTAYDHMAAACITWSDYAQTDEPLYKSCEAYNYWQEGGPPHQFGVAGCAMGILCLKKSLPPGSQLKMPTRPERTALARRWFGQKITGCAGTVEEIVTADRAEGK